MRNNLMLGIFCLLLVSFVDKICCGKCPNPRKVMKQTIIQSNESIKNGARLIGKDIVDSARECYKLCCKDESCNVAVMHYKEKLNALKNTITEKYCFLFDCGYPSVCSYEYHHRYAIIDLGFRDAVNNKKSTALKAHHIATTKAPTTVAPTTQATVTIAKKETTVLPTKSESTVNVPSSVKVATENVAVSHIHNEEALTVTETDYGETPDESLPSGNGKETYYNSERRTWLPQYNGSAKVTVAPEPDLYSKLPVVVVVKSNEAVSLMSLPLLIALIICILLLIGVIYRVKCVARGKPKKVPIDDGDYLINGMYL